MKNILTVTLDHALTASGFTKNGDTWYSEKSETILVVNLQKSQWGEQYYINLAAWFKELGESKFPPKEHLCHVRTRLTSLTNGSLEKALNLESKELDDSRREPIVGKAIKEVAIPFLDQCSTLKGLKRQYEGDRLAKVMVHKNLKHLMIATI